MRGTADSVNFKKALKNAAVVTTTAADFFSAIFYILDFESRKSR